MHLLAWPISLSLLVSLRSHMHSHLPITTGLTTVSHALPSPYHYWSHYSLTCTPTHLPPSQYPRLHLYYIYTYIDKYRDILPGNRTGNLLINSQIPLPLSHLTPPPIPYSSGSLPCPQGTPVTACFRCFPAPTHLIQINGSLSSSVEAW